MKQELTENCVVPFVYIDHLVKLEIFADNFELTLDSIINKNQILIVTLDNFNTKTTNWYKNNVNSYEGLDTDTITNQFGLQQLINEPTYLT